MREILISKGNRVIVDDADYNLLNKTKWSTITANTTCYAHGKPTRNEKSISMHRFIMGNPHGLEIDHINGNGLDNRRENLRIGTHKQNMQNIHIVYSSKKDLFERYKGCYERGLRLNRLINNIRSELLIIGFTEDALKAYEDKTGLFKGVVKNEGLFFDPFILAQIREQQTVRSE